MQDAVQRALSPPNGEMPIIKAAGRTDSGAHACLQIAHFDAKCVRAPEVWTRAANARLSPHVRLLWTHPVAADFDARYSATRRCYQYLLLNRRISSAHMHSFCGFYAPPLSLPKMQEGAAQLLGRRDFSAFRAASCQAKTPFRTIYAANVDYDSPMFIFDFCADGFLQHMIRNIIGALIDIGEGKKPPQWIAQLLQNKSRALAAPTAAAAGLYFIGVDYPPHFGIPESRRLPPISPRRQNI